MHHSPILDGDFLVHDRAQSPDDAALHLRLHRIRMDDVTAVERDDDAFDVDHVAAFDRELDHRRGETAVGVHHCDAAVNAFGRRPVPGRRLCHGIQHAQVLLPLQQWPAELVRILARSQRQFVDEAFAEERVVGMRHGPPETRGHMRIAHRILVGEVGYRVGIVLKAARVDRIDAVFDHGRTHRDDDRLIRLANVPAGPVAVLIEPGAQLHQRDGAIAALAHVFLARPLQPDRSAAHGLRDLHRLLGVLLVRSAPTETAAGVHLVHVHAFQRNTRGLRSRGDGGLAVLGANPDVDALVRHQRGGGLRLHRGVVQIRRVILGLDDLCRAGECADGIAVLARNRRILCLDPGAQELHDRCTGNIAVLAHVPLDWQRLERLVGAPPVVGNHRDPIVSGHHALDSAHALDLGFVEALQLAAEYRALHHRGVHQAGQAHVSGVDLLAGSLIRDVEARRRSADQLPVLLVL